MKKNKPVISRAGVKPSDIERLKGALLVAKNKNLLKALSETGKPFLFYKKFVERSFLQAYITKAERDLLYSMGWVRADNGHTILKDRKDERSFLKAYPNIGNRLLKEIKSKTAFLEKHGWKVELNIRRKRNAKILSA